MAVVSVITPLYNSEKLIARAIESVQGQTFQDWEMIIVDDCSLDDSAKVAESYASIDKRVKVIALDVNSGPAVARNIAIQMSVGRYVAFLDSDDVWRHEKLARQLSFIREKDAALVFSSYSKRDEAGNSLGVVRAPEKIGFNDLLKCCVIGCLTAMYDTHKIGKMYMPEIRKRQDFALWLSILKRVDYAFGQNFVAADYTVREESVSSKKLDSAKYQWKVYRDVEKLPFFSSSYYFLNYSFRGFMRLKLPRVARFLKIL